MDSQKSPEVVAYRKKQKRMAEILSRLGEIEIEKVSLERQKAKLLAEYEQLNQIVVNPEGKEEKGKSKFHFPEDLKHRREEADLLIDLLRLDYLVGKPRIYIQPSSVVCWELKPTHEPTIRWGLWLQSSGWSMDKINTKDPDEWGDYFPCDVYDFAISNDLELAE